MIKKKNGMIPNKNGDKYWYDNGRMHRGDDLPAVECHLGTNEYWLCNQRVERDELFDYKIGKYGDGNSGLFFGKNKSKYWLIDGKEVLKEEFKSWIVLMDLEQKIPNHMLHKKIKL